MPDWIVPVLMFLVGWAFAISQENGWKSPILWVVSAIAVAIAIPLLY